MTSDETHGEESKHKVSKLSAVITEEEKKVLEKFFSHQALVYDPLKAGSIDGTDTVAHDKAVSRASTAVYHPPLTGGDPERTVLVARLNPRTTEEKLARVFTEYGRIRRCKLVRCLVTGESRRYAFVEYEDKSAAEKAFRHGHNTKLDDALILVDYECERVLPGWVPRRLGGGFGGKRESGQLRFGCRDRPYRKPIPLVAKSLQRDDNT